MLFSTHYTLLPVSASCQQAQPSAKSKPHSCDTGARTCYCSLSYTPLSYQFLQAAMQAKSFAAGIMGVDSPPSDTTMMIPLYLPVTRP